MPTPDEVREAMKWLDQRGGAFYPTAAIYVMVIKDHVADLERQIEMLILRQDASIQGQG